MLGVRKNAHILRTPFLPVDRHVRLRIQLPELPVEPLLASRLVVHPELTHLSRRTREVNRHRLRVAEVNASHVTTRVLAPFEVRVAVVDEHAQYGQELDRGELDLVAPGVERLDRVVD